MSRDVIFEENSNWNFDKNHGEAIVVDLKWEDNENESVVMMELRLQRKLINIMKDAEESGSSDINRTEGNSSSLSKGHSLLSHEERERRRPVWMRHYASGGLSEEENVAYLAMFASYDDRVYLEDAMESLKWREMDAEIEDIERNDTWELTNLPAGAKKVGVK